MPKLHALADRLLTRFVPKSPAAASCGTRWICDGGPKYRCELTCEGELVNCVVVGWCW